MKAMPLTCEACGLWEVSMRSHCMAHKEGAHLWTVVSTKEDARRLWSGATEDRGCRAWSPRKNVARRFIKRQSGVERLVTASLHLASLWSSFS